MVRIAEVLGSGRLLISDGAWGTSLMAMGFELGQCPELWCVTRPDDVRRIAREYAAAGADIIGTNSFGGSSLRLGDFGLADRAEELGRAAARLSRQEAGERWVAGSIGPTGRMLFAGDVTERQLYDSYREQASALESGGADVLCIETMSDVQEAEIAISACKENTGCEVFCTFTFERTTRGEYRTMMGVSPTAAALAAAAAGADVIGANCGNGMEAMLPIIEEMRAAKPCTPILVQANAGLPVQRDGRTVFPESPEQMAAMVGELVRAGANIIGGCCGTTPAHISAIRRAILQLT